MLTTIEQVQKMPGFNNTVRFPVPWMNDLIGSCDRAIKLYCKQGLELQAYQEFYSGNNTREVVINEVPVLTASTTIAAGSNGTVLPTATINVTSTKGFDPGITQGSVNSDAQPPTLTVQTGLNSLTPITYTGTTGTSFTGCTGGTGTLSSAVNLNRVWTPTVWFDPNGYGGQTVAGFADGTLLIMGAHFMLVLGRGGKRSKSGLLRRIGGSGSGFVGYYPENMYSGKLGAYHLPGWYRGDGNIKIAYSAGYPITEVFDLSQVCCQLIAETARTAPTGANLSSESLGAYSYNTLVNSEEPEMADIRRKLAPYRESSF